MATAAFLVTGIFLSIDTAFAANALKIAHGSWLPLVIGLAIFTLLTTWKTRRAFAERSQSRPFRLPDSWTAHFLPHCGCAVKPCSLTRNLTERHRRSLTICDTTGASRVVVVLIVITEPVPHVPRERQTGISFRWRLPWSCATGSWRIQCAGGARLARADGLEMGDDEVTYFLGRETIIVTERPGWSRAWLFVMITKWVRATAFFHPPER